MGKECLDLERCKMIFEIWNADLYLAQCLFVIIGDILASFLLMKILRFPAAPILKEVNAHSAISLHLLYRDGNSRSSMWLLATVQLPFTKLCVVLQDCTAHLSEMKEEEGRGEEMGGWEEVRRMRQAAVGGAVGWKGGGPRRQMPPLWLWHCWILIVQCHIVPTLLEMWAPSCCALITR